MLDFLRRFAFGLCPVEEQKRNRAIEVKKQGLPTRVRRIKNSAVLGLGCIFRQER
jgi:hypothetical protein